MLGAQTKRENVLSVGGTICSVALSCVFMSWHLAEFTVRSAL